MPGILKSGLLFGVPALMLGMICAIFPILAMIVMPGLAALLATIAGYLSVRWSPGQSEISSGIWAGGIVGLSALIGPLLKETFFRIGLITAMTNSLCLGGLYLVPTLACGALGAWLALRRLERRKRIS